MMTIDWPRCCRIALWTFWVVLALAAWASAVETVNTTVAGVGPGAFYSPFNRNWVADQIAPSECEQVITSGAYDYRLTVGYAGGWWRLYFYWRDSPGGQWYLEKEYTIDNSNTFGTAVEDLPGSMAATRVGGAGADWPATVAVTHDDGIPDAPTANAGPDRTINAIAAWGSTRLNGSGSIDPDGEIVRYLWECDDPDWEFDPVISDGPEPLTAPFFVAVGTWEFRLTVTDDDDLTSTDTMVVTCNDNETPAVVEEPTPPDEWPDKITIVPQSTSCDQYRAKIISERTAAAVAAQGSGTTWGPREATVTIGANGGYRFESHSMPVFDPVSVQLLSDRPIDLHDIPLVVDWGGAPPTFVSALQSLGNAWHVGGAPGDPGEVPPGADPDPGAMAAIAAEIPDCGGDLALSDYDPYGDNDGDGIPWQFDEDDASAYTPGGSPQLPQVDVPGMSIADGLDWETDYDHSWTVPITVPGVGGSGLVIHSVPSNATDEGAAFNSFRLLLRGFLAVLVYLSWGFTWYQVFWQY